MEMGKELVEKANKKEVGTKTTQPQLVAYTYHKGPYDSLGAAFDRLASWIYENGYQIAGPSVTICYNDPRGTKPEDLISEVQFPVMKSVGAKPRCSCCGG
jgi:effector-binding domain-containing protein